MNRLNEWWQKRSFHEIEKITKLRQSDFDPEAGYQSFVDTCDHRWDGLSVEEKKSIVEEYH